MKTMTSVLRHGRTVWDSDLLPEDEYFERVRLMRGRMEDLGLDILIGLGHTTRTGDFTYLSGHVPPLNWMAAVLGRQVGPLLVTGGGSRDVPFLSTQSWLTDIRTSSSLFSGPAAVIGNAIEEMAEPGARIGLAGVEDALDSAQAAEFTQALSVYEVVDAGPLVAEVRAVKRPRELLALSDSLAIARRAMDAGLQAWRDGAATAESLLAVERHARLGGAREVRVLGGSGDLDLAPPVAASTARGEEIVIQCVVERRGYWGQACVSSADVSVAAAAVDAMVAAARANVAAGSVATAALATLDPQSAEVALSYGLGAGIGLDEAESPFIIPDSDVPIAVGTLLALQVITRAGGRLVCAHATVLVGEHAASRW